MMTVLPKDATLPTVELRSTTTLHIGAEYYKTQKEYKKAPLMFLLPVTATLDVISAPFVGLYSLYSLNLMNGHPSGVPH